MARQLGGRRFEVGKDQAGEWRWTFYAANGEAIAVSSEGYKNEDDCIAGIDLVKASASAAIMQAARRRRRA